MITISLFRICKTNILRSRELANEVLKNLDSGENVILDFKKITFVSQSFANELLFLIEEKKLNVQFISRSKDVKIIMDAAFNRPELHVKFEKAKARAC